MKLFWKFLITKNKEKEKRVKKIARFLYLDFQCVAINILVIVLLWNGPSPPTKGVPMGPLCVMGALVQIRVFF